jgi:hypothetical protein
MAIVTSAELNQIFAALGLGTSRISRVRMNEDDRQDGGKDRGISHVRKNSSYERMPERIQR